MSLSEAITGTSRSSRRRTEKKAKADQEGQLAFAQEQADVFAVIGVHPHDAKTITPETYARLRELAQQPKVVGIGETGLDFYYDNSPREAQRIERDAPPLFQIGRRSPISPLRPNLVRRPRMEP